MKKTYLISYDLGVPETHADYTALSQHFKKLYSTWARPVKSVWIVKSDKTAGEIRTDIKTILDLNDKLIVVELSGSWATCNIAKDITDWMHKNM